MPAANHLVLLVEEPSMEAFLHALLPRLMPARRTFEIHPFQGKDDLMAKLEARLRAYAQWLPDDWRVLVIVDRDDEDCKALKSRMEAIGTRAGLLTRTRAVAAAGHGDWQLANRIAVEELEAWYFGDWPAVQAVYPKLPDGVPKSRGLRDPDAITGGTWEAFERVLQRHGYAKAGLAKIEAARAIGRHIEPSRSRSPSFLAFHAALAEALV
ncbi:conserved hypothetical protein [Leptothrix cholodnii SP-6]|uniref:DUF4276 family protein n=1 Tax=Leptothrix cholodnii (strain ATCC 51168 / LMG 8142 / SP-6) TaxID=395495 RepID=B1Y1D3_LEPCP|nr:DUF4276 family protein [Leptothrix cholodnii]ACB34232.1 conserved hypothetical protein [Leptothrix cholodnii SP-6]